MEFLTSDYLIVFSLLTSDDKVNNLISVDLVLFSNLSLMASSQIHMYDMLGEGPNYLVLVVHNAFNSPSVFQDGGRKFINRNVTCNRILPPRYTRQGQTILGNDFINSYV